MLTLKNLNYYGLAQRNTVQTQLKTWKISWGKSSFKVLGITFKSVSEYDQEIP